MEVEIFILLAFMVAGWIQGVIGFGFAVATTLLLVNQMDFTTLVFLNLSMSVVTSLVAMLSGKNLKAIHKSTLWKLFASSFAGLALGIMIINIVDAVTLKTITLLAILMASVLSLTKLKAFFAHAYMLWVTGFFSGILTPSTGINGPLVALYLNAAFEDKRRTRVTMLAYLFLLMTFGVIFMSLQANLPPYTGSLLLKVLLPSLIGYGIGLFTFRKLSNSVFKITTTIFLIFSSVTSLLYLII